MKQNKTKETWLVGWQQVVFLAKIRREKEKQVFGVRLPLFCGVTCTVYPHVYNSSKILFSFKLIHKIFILVYVLSGGTKINFSHNVKLLKKVKNPT